MTAFRHRDQNTPIRDFGGQHFQVANMKIANRMFSSSKLLFRFRTDLDGLNSHLHL